MFDFSPLEIQLVRSSLASKTDEEIAEILERPIDLVHVVINQITGGVAVERNQRVLDVKKIIKAEYEKKIQARVDKEAGRRRREEKSRERNQVKSVEQERADKEQRERNTSEKMNHIRKREKTAWEDRKSYKTKVIDWSKMKSVRVSKSTLILVEKHVKDRDAIDLYYQNMEKKQRSASDKEVYQKMNNKPQNT